MKICLLMGSPHLNGTTAQLSDAFIEGARSAGHEVEKIDIAALTIQPCTAELLDKIFAGGSVDEDGMASVFASLMRADAVVFATPLYYYGMTAQLKTVLDRLVSKNDAIAEKGLDAALLVVAAGPDTAAIEPLESQFRALCGYLRMKNRGTVSGLGLALKPLEENGALERARAFGAAF